MHSKVATLVKDLHALVCYRLHCFQKAEVLKVEQVVGPERDAALQQNF
jgi:hypothetical protein